MTEMSSYRPPGSTWFLWSLRAHLWIPVVCVFGLAAGALLWFAQPSEYQATALVVTRQIDPNVKVLPQYATSVFHNGAVAREVAAAPGVTTPPELVPSQLAVIAPEDSITLTVVSTSVDANEAARLADAGAAAFVTELNRGGPGVGTFLVQSPAIVPAEPTDGYPPLLAAVLGGLAGALLGLGVVALAAVLRRPVLAAQDVLNAVGLRLIDDLAVPRSAEPPHPRAIPGFAGVARKLATVPSTHLLLLSARRDTVLRQQTLLALGVALTGLRTVRLHGDPTFADRMHDLTEQAPHAPVPGGAPLVLVDQTEPPELVGQVRTALPVLVVAEKGISSARLRQVVAEHLGSELLGVLLVRRSARAAAGDAMARLSGPRPAVSGTPA